MDPQILQAELETGSALTNRITKRVDLQLEAFEISVKFAYLYLFFAGSTSDITCHVMI